MIGKLTGRLDTVVEGGCILDVNGVGYLLACSSRTVAALSGAERGVALVETVVREDAITLYGFADGAERDWFRLLTGIQGVGPKVALSLLSALAPGDLAAAILAGDRASLSRAQGVGPKLAARLVAELRERVGGMATGPAFAPVAAPAPGGSAGADALSALLNLGYRRPEAQAALARAGERLGENAALGALITGALRELAPK